MATPSLTRMRSTSDRSLISAPASRAALASASRHRSDAAADAPARCDGLPLRCREQQEDRGAAGRAHAEKRSEHAAGRDRRTQRLALEPLPREVRDGHRHPSEQPIRVGPAERSELPAGSQQLKEIGGRGMVDRRRFGGQHASKHGAHGGDARRRTPGSGRRRVPRTPRSRARPRRGRPTTSARGHRAAGEHTSARGLTICRPCRLEAERADDRRIDRRAMRERRTAESRARPRSSAPRRRPARSARARAASDPPWPETRPRQDRCAATTIR